MKEIIRKSYQCEICGYEHNTKDAALECEKIPIIKNKGAKNGDIIRILSGDGLNEMARVLKICVIQPDYFPAYTHTIGVQAEFIYSTGCRFLLWNNYELIG